MTLVETRVILPDGRSGTTYELSLSPSSSHGSQAAGNAGFSSEAGDLEDISEDDDADNTGEDTDGSSGQASGDGSETGSDGSQSGAPPAGPGGGPAGPGGDGSGSGETPPDGEGDAFDALDIEGTGDGHSIGFNDQFAAFGASSSLVDIGVSLTVGEGDTTAQFAPVVNVLANADSSSGGLFSSGLNFDVQESDDEGFQYLSIGGSSTSGGLAGFDYSSQLQDETSSALASANVDRSTSIDFSIEDTGHANDSGKVRVISNREYTDAAGNLFVEKTLASSGGTESGLAEFGFEDGAFGDTGKTSDNSNHFFLDITRFEGAGPATQTADTKRQVSATFDFEAAFDDSGSVTDVILGLTDGQTSSGTDQIIVRTERNELTENLPHLPGYRLDRRDVTEVTVDLDYDATEDDVSGTLTTTTEEWLDQIAEGIFFGTADGEAGTPPPIHTHTAETQSFDLASDEAREILVGLGLLPRSTGDILAEYRERVEQAIRTQRLIDALDSPEHDDLRAHLEGVLQSLNAELDRLVTEAAEAGVPPGDLAAARQAAENKAAMLDTGAFIDRLDGDSEWVIDDIIVGGLTGVGHGGSFIANAITLHQIDPLNSYVDRLVDENGRAYAIANISANVGVAALAIAGAPAAVGGLKAFAAAEFTLPAYAFGGGGGAFALVGGEVVGSAGLVIGGGTVTGSQLLGIGTITLLFLEREQIARIAEHVVKDHPDRYPGQSEPDVVAKIEDILQNFQESYFGQAGRQIWRKGTEVLINDGTGGGTLFAPTMGAARFLQWWLEKEFGG